MINVSNEVKNAYQNSTTQIDKIVIDNKEYRINNVQYYDDCYDNGNIFGTAIARCVEFEIENSIDLENKEFEYLTGIKINGVIHWISLGNFITQDIEANDTTNIANITAMDYMLKSNVEYKTNLDYSSNKVTILQVLQEACKNAGLVLATTDFANKNFIVDSNQFKEGTLIRQVFQAIAQLSGTFAKIKSDNKLYFITPKKDIIKVKDIHEMTVYEVDNWIIGKSYSDNNCSLSDYEELELKRQTHPINVVSLGLTDIEGENITLRDEENIKKNGKNILVINDNPFAYTQEKREQLIIALFEVVRGFEYTSYEIKGQAKPYLETGDEIIVVDKQGNTRDSFLFRFNYKSPNGLESEMSAPSIIKATVTYQNVPDAMELVKRTEIIVDKQNQTITEILQKTEGNEQKIVEVEKNIEGITATVADNKEEINEALETTKTELETQIKVSAEGVESNVNKTLESYSTTEETNKNISNAKTEAINSANTSTDNKLKKYSTTTQMNSAINQKANEISTSVSESYITKTDSATNILNAKSEAINTAGTNTDNKLKNYSTTTEMNSAITQKANEITSTVSKTYSTKTETSTAKQEAIDSANSTTNNKLKDYTETSKLGTAIEQNYEHVKVAWNQISDFIQMMIINKNASLAILDKDKKVMTALDKLGQHFYNSSSKIFAEMGVKTVDNDNYIAFSVPSDYNSSISDGMAWGITTTSDNKFLPVLFLKNFSVGNKNAGNYGGELVLKFCDLVLEGLESGIKSGDVKMYGNMFNGITFEDITTGQVLLDIIPANSSLGTDNEISILDAIKFYKNAGGSNSLKIGNDSYVLMTDEGSLQVQNGNILFGTKGSEVEFDLYVNTLANITGNLNVNGNVYANNISSDRRIKKNIKDSEKSALDLIMKIKHKQFEKIEDNKHYDIGYIAQEMEEIDPNFVMKREKTKATDEKYYINELPIIATITKAIQEQQEEIEQLKAKIKEMEEK